MLANVVVMEPRFVLPVPHTPEEFGRTAWLSFAFWRPYAPSSPKKDAGAAGFNRALTTFIARGATGIAMPSPPSGVWAGRRRLQELAAPSLARRLRFVDGRSSLWRAVERYFEPIHDCVLDSVGLITPESTLDEALTIEATWEALHLFAWQSYLLLLAWKEGAEVDLGADAYAVLLRPLTNAKFSAEARARLNLLAALYAGYETSASLPGFAVSQDAAFGDRVEEMLDDAHFLEVSALRRFFGFAQNKRAIIRDLRRLTRFIVRNKRWAKGALKMADHHAVLSNGSADFLQMLAPEASSNTRRPPIIVDTTTLFPNLLLFNGRRAVKGGWFTNELVRNLEV